MMPVPTYLKECLVPYESIIDEEPLRGSLKCMCGCEIFRMLYPGSTHEYEGSRIPCTLEVDGIFFFLIRVECAECHKVYTLFDQDFHGWNGVVCHDSKQADLERPSLICWQCFNCASEKHKAVIEITTQGKEDFIGATEGNISEDRWQDAFDWLTISITCVDCGQKTKNWVDCEGA